MRIGIKSLFNDYPEMEVIGEAINGKEAIEKAKLIKPDIILENQMYTELYETIKLMDKSTKDILLNFHNDVHKKSTVALFEQFEQSSYLQEWRKININIIKYGSIYGPNDKPTINTQTVDSQEQSVQQPKNTQVQNNTQEYPSQVNKRRGRGR